MFLRAEELAESEVERGWGCEVFAREFAEEGAVGGARLEGEMFLHVGCCGCGIEIGDWMRSCCSFRSDEENMHVITYLRMLRPDS